MWMDEFDSFEDIDASWNTTSNWLEVSEKFRESVKKAASKTQKVQKDEKKARKYDFLLAHFLIKIILEKKFDDLVVLLFPCRDRWYPSNFLLWIFSLVYIDISNSIRETSKKKTIDFNYKNTEQSVFDDNNIPEEIRYRINHWVEDMVDVVNLDSSEIQCKRLVKLLDNIDDDLHEFIVKIFVYFFASLNIEISDLKAYNYIDFILLELKKSYRTSYFARDIEILD